ncbi:hypothetical protein M747DRAFT_103588 [Aspergillus niger ATCC 13496]|uniref:Uncharacterized protein n=1 Tax=Aspergillus niger ATCC 13496 TaxID=1353008 RepID=A0A370BV11_ASPNG|nr:hypothetical protein M747DRAFT_103588 [Aspergillus niger ATCC 13496]
MAWRAYLDISRHFVLRTCAGLPLTRSVSFKTVIGYVRRKGTWELQQSVCHITQSTVGSYLPRAETIPDAVNSPSTKDRRLKTPSPELIYLKINRLTLCSCGLNSVAGFSQWDHRKKKNRGSIDYSCGLHNFSFLFPFSLPSLHV